jgi:4-aminobutyrate aminotransferase-like enzyme
VCAAVALVNIDIIINEQLSANANQVGNYLKSRLTELIDRHPIVGDLRGRGLMLGVELVKDRQTKVPLTEREASSIWLDVVMQGVLMPYGTNILKLLPPLIIDKTIADTMVSIIDQSLHATEGSDMEVW